MDGVRVDCLETAVQYVSGDEDVLLRYILSLRVRNFARGDINLPTADVMMLSFIQFLLFFRHLHCVVFVFKTHI